MGESSLTRCASKCSHYLPCQWDDRIMRLISPFVAFAQFCVVIWGSVLVFGWYSTWVYDPKFAETPEYCGYTPYMYSFVMLIIGWCTIPFLLCCFCTFLTAMNGVNCFND